MQKDFCVHPQFHGQVTGKVSLARSEDDHSRMWQTDAQTEDLQELWLRSSSQCSHAKPSDHLGKDTLL